MKHELKIDTAYLDQLVEGSKTFEIRYNDRGYQKGDWLCFCGKKYGSDYEVTYVHSGLGLKEGFVALGVKRIDKSGDCK
jgi:ASC-1-like (ASCH) protein